MPVVTVTDGAIEPLPSGLVEDLSVALPEVIQTHISHLFLSADRVYKLRKAVRFPFLSFSTRADRNQDCLRELALNRRLAPDVYLGVAPVEFASGRFRLGRLADTLTKASDGSLPEHCVVMRRLPAGFDAQSLLETGRLGDEQLDAAAASIAAFHESVRLGRPAPFSSEAWRRRNLDPVVENLRLIRECPADASHVVRAAGLEERARAWFADRAEEFERRRVEGRAVDGHGDLQLQHLWFEPGRLEPLVIDCTEFNADFRRIDAASEVAFLCMDLRYRRRPEAAERFLRRYARDCDDYQLYRVIAYYESYRAAVRSKVASLACGELEISPAQRAAARQSAGAHLDLAESSLDFSVSGSGVLVLLCGLVGTGKSTLAESLADACGGVVVSSDRTRKRLAGLAFDDRSGAEAGLYDSANSDRVYAALLERGEHVLASGRVAILDATFDRAERRAQARSWAERSGVTCLLVETRCDRAQVLRQLAARQAEGRDPSDAGPERYEESVRRFEPVSAEERTRTRHQLARGIPVRQEDLAAAIDSIRNLQRAACAPPRSAPD